MLTTDTQMIQDTPAQYKARMHKACRENAWRRLQRLRNAIVGGIQNLFTKFVAQVYQVPLQFAVPRPRPHVDDVLQNELLASLKTC